ncbi:hypothetical protein BV20DRAFT_996130 [Pilatotrama ljubarskyi]|nr:hypothetical protein BV20DRAFT_996130 [Pilatotrama ljubarskyi]
MAAYAEEDRASESSLEDGPNAQSMPLLPMQSWSPSAFKEKFLPSSPTSSIWPSRMPPGPAARRRCLILGAVLLVTLGSIPLFLSGRLYSDSHEGQPVREISEFNPTLPTASPSGSELAQYGDGDIDGEDAYPVHLRPETYLEGPIATTHFRDSLRNDTGYMTSFLSAGWTNDQITIGNLIYLALIAGRIPILPPFTSYIGSNSAPIPFSEIFDLPRMVSALNSPILEWHMVKDIERSHAENAKDEIGCWNIWEVDNMQSDGPRGSYSTVLLNLDISYTRAPQSVKLIPNYEHDSHSTFWSLAKLAFPEGRAQVLANPSAHPIRPSESSKVMLPPDEQLVCYDYLYYVCALEPFEFERDYSPMWREVMVHAHWTAPLEDLAKGYLRRLFRLPENAAIPPYIAIHARRGDFLGWCGDVPKDDCFAPLSAFARRVREVQEEVRLRHGIYVSHVIMTGDEKDPLWWSAVEERGWLRLDHAAERTAEQYGNWYPVILDAVVQSMSVGFVGTDRSTFSHMARRRVSDWNHGAVRLVKWGTVGADDH